MVEIEFFLMHLQWHSQPQSSLYGSCVDMLNVTELSEEFYYKLNK